VPFAENEDVIQTLAPDRTDEALGKRILPRAVRRGEDFVDPHALHSVPKLLAVDPVTVAQEIGRRGVAGEGVHDLLGGPVGGGVLGHVEVNDAAAMVGEHDEDEEDAEPSGGHGEEIDRDEVSEMIGQKRPAGLGGRGAPLREQPRDGAFGHIDAELQELAMDSWGTPDRVRGGHADDQGFDLGVDRRTTAGRPAGEPGPVRAKAAPLPPQDGVRGHDHEELSPPGPDAGQTDPEQTIRRAKSGPGRCSLVDGELLAQG
jgi:hypothetical protein